MDRPDPLNEIRREMVEQGIDLLLAFHDGAHFIEKPNAVMVLSGFKSMGPAMVMMPRDGKPTLVVTPPWDVERAADCAPDFHNTADDDLVDVLANHISSISALTIGTAGLAAMPWRVSERLEA